MLRKLFVVAAIAGVFLAGCESTSPTAPDQDRAVTPAEDCYPEIQPC